MQRALPGVLSVDRDAAPPQKVRPQEGGAPDASRLLQGYDPRRVGPRIGPAAPGAGVSHVYEFPDRWVLHRDVVDAEADPLGHLLSDAPEYLVSALVGLATGLFAKKQKDGRNALLAGWSTAAFMLLLGKMGKTIGEDDRENEAKAPRFS